MVGFSIETIRLDVIQILDLGILQWLIGSVLWELIQNNFMRVAGDVVFRRLANLNGIRRRMRAYYRQRTAEGAQLSKIHRITMAMLGTRAKPRLKAKAAETRHLLPLALHMCPQASAEDGRAPSVPCDPCRPDGAVPAVPGRQSHPYPHT